MSKFFGNVFNPEAHEFIYKCNKCKVSVAARYHCLRCHDFDLCIPCYEKVGHPHMMKFLCSQMDGGGPSSSNQTNPGEANISIQQCIQSLMHASWCTGNCLEPSCHRMKRIVEHVKVCTGKANAECPICKQFIALCYFHVTMCTEDVCVMPFCASIKDQKNQSEFEENLRQAQALLNAMVLNPPRGAGMAPRTPRVQQGMTHLRATPGGNLQPGRQQVFGMDAGGSSDPATSNTAGQGSGNMKN